jgi:basic membrane protein A
MSGIQHKILMQKLSRQKILLSIILPAVLVTWIAIITCSSISIQSAYAQTQNSSSQAPASANQSLKIAYLTDGLFSDAGWGAFAYNAGQEIISKHGYEVSFLDNV